MKRGLVLAVALGSAGCMGGGAVSAVSVSAKVSSSSSALTVSPATVTVTRARLAVGGLTSSGTAITAHSDMSGGCANMGGGRHGHHGSDSDSDSGSGSESSTTASTTGSTLDLSAADLASGAEKALSSINARAGAYDSLGLAVAPVTADASSTDELAQSGASAIIEGTIGDKAFRWVGHFQASQTIASAELTEGADAITLNVDPSTWFVDTDGTQLDPSDATQSAKIADSICASLKLSDATHPAAAGRGAACVSTGL